MSIALIDYGCHSFSYRLAETLHKRRGIPVNYIANGSLESPNLSSLAHWVSSSPDMVCTISCDKPYGKMGLTNRLQGEFAWGHRCVSALRQSRPEAIIVNCVPLMALSPIHRWARSQKIPLIYWLQDIQSRAVHELLGRQLGVVGRTLGAFAHLWEQTILEQSDMVITIAPGHENELPQAVRRSGRHALLENWANIEEFPQFAADNDWSRHHGLSQTLNIMYSGTLGLKHDLNTFFELAKRFQSNPDVRIVIISTGQAVEKVRTKAISDRLNNIVVLPFQHHAQVPMALASAAILIAPLEASAGSFCVPSKILSYLCAGRPTILAINESNAAAQTILNAGAGYVVPPGNPEAFVASVEKLLTNSDLRRSIGNSARAYAESMFGIDNVVEHFLAILDRVSPLLARPVLVQTVAR